jgi:hypothetical protein
MANSTPMKVEDYLTEININLASILDEIKRTNKELKQLQREIVRSR